MKFSILEMIFLNKNMPYTNLRFNYLFNLLFPILNSNSLKNTINDNI